MFFLPTPNTLRFATLYAALVCAVLEGSGLVSPRSCQSQGPIWQKRGVFLLVLPLPIQREGETEESCVGVEELLSSSRLKGGMKASFALCVNCQEWEIYS